MADDLHARLLATITARRELAEAATISGARRAGWLLRADPARAARAQWRRLTHSAANDPAQILRDTDAHLALLAEISRWRHLVVEDCWYTCAAATEVRDGGTTCDDHRAGGGCDCGLDQRRETIVLILASVYPEVGR